LARVSASHHIIENIIAHADKATQFTCLRVNRDWHETAGKYAYHSITLSGDSIWGVLFGALVGSGIKTANPLLEHAEMCMAEDVHSCGHTHLLEWGGSRNAAQRDQPPPSSYDGHTLATLISLSFLHQHGSPPASTIPNFKVPLLKHVRVVTLGAHHHCFCRTWYLRTASLFPNVRVLRIVPPCEANTVHPLCSPYGCPLVVGFNVEHVVFRNLDYNGATLMFHHYCLVPMVKKLTLFLPIQGGAWDPVVAPNLSLGKHYPRAEINVVFHDTWEGAPGALTAKPVNVTQVMTALFTLLMRGHCLLPGYACGCAAAEEHNFCLQYFKAAPVNIYGLGKLRFARDIDAYQLLDRVGGSSTDEARLLQALKEELVSFDLTSQVFYGPGVVESVPEHVVAEVKANTKFPPIGAYMKDEESRRFEITAE
jgi:hypothetical protein